MDITFIFVCGVTVVAAVLFFRRMGFNLFGTQSQELVIVSRKEWNAYDSKANLDFYEPSAFPLNYVVITHTASCDAQPTTMAESSKVLRNLQEEAFAKDWADIPNNFLVDNQGIIYEGRGTKIIPAACLGWNRKSLGVAIIGDFTYDKPSEKAAISFKKLFNKLIDDGVLSNDFTLYCLGQLREKFIAQLDTELYMEIKTWKGDHGYEWSWRPYLEG